MLDFFMTLGSLLLLLISRSLDYDSFPQGSLHLGSWAITRFPVYLSRVFLSLYYLASVACLSHVVYFLSFFISYSLKFDFLGSWSFEVDPMLCVGYYFCEVAFTIRDIISCTHYIMATLGQIFPACLISVHGFL